MDIARRTYTPKEAAQIVGIGRNKIYELIKLGVIRAVRVGSHIHIPHDAIDEFLGVK
jgi:excisionase family DNA binding protein